MNKLNEQLSRTKELMGILNEQKAGDPIEVENLPDWLKDFIKKYNINAKYNLVGHSTGSGYEYDKVFGMKMGVTSTSISEEEINTYEKNKGNIRKCKEMNNRRRELEGDKMGEEERGGESRGEGEKRRKKLVAVRKEIEKKLKEEYPNMEYCGILEKVQSIIDK